MNNIPLETHSTSHATCSTTFSLHFVQHFIFIFIFIHCHTFPLILTMKVYVQSFLNLECLVNNYSLNTFLTPCAIFSVMISTRFAHLFIFVFFCTRPPLILTMKVSLLSVAMHWYIATKYSQETHSTTQTLYSATIHHRFAQMFMFSFSRYIFSFIVSSFLSSPL